jgi:HSP20 family protein
MDLVRRGENRRPTTTGLGTFDRLRDEINRLFDVDPFGDAESGLFDRELAPRVDVEDTDKEVQVHAEVPGMNKDDLDISVAGNTLTIRGEKSGGDEKEGRNYYRRETWEGSFQRSITLPDTVDQENPKAEMNNGVLTVHFPKREDVKPRKINVDVN